MSCEEVKNKRFLEELPDIVSQLCNGLISDGSIDDKRINSVVTGALKLKQVDESAYYAVLAVGLTEVATRLNLGKPAGELFERAVRYCTERSEYLREPKQADQK